ncbi:immunity 26/phosphotriesterase HocA family protein [Hymenobacter antarcticus]|uniref:Immunity protein 26 n=1 Tax=Hymenobacter antarcticus TaxID=486270 RepID=A0ABP7PYP1_9BACT
MLWGFFFRTCGTRDDRKSFNRIDIEMARQRRTVGSIIEIDLGEGHFSYGRILDFASFAFYDIHVTKQEKDISKITNKPILFIIAVYNDVVSSGRWVKIGSEPLPQSLQILPTKFIQDALHLDRFELYYPNSGEIRPASKEACEGLERCAVWDANHVEDRLRDHFAGRPCKWMREDLELFA